MALNLLNKYLAQDALHYLFNATDLTADGAGTEFDFGVAGGCPNGMIVGKVSSLNTGDSVLLKLQSGGTSGSLSNTGHQVSIAADGTFCLAVNNDMVTSRYMNLYADLTLGSGLNAVVTAYFVPFQRF